MSAKAGNLIELKVEGMDCNNCAASIHRFLERKGLDDVYVNFSTKEVRFRLGDSGLELDQVKRGIDKLGYQVVREGDSKESWWTLERKLLISAAFALPLLLHHLLMMAGLAIPFLDNPWVQLLVCLPPFIIGFLHFGHSALSSLRGGVPNMDVLIFMGSTAAFVYSLIGTFLKEPDYLFYETSATIIALVLLGNWFEKRAVQQTTSAIRDLAALQPQQARRIMPSGTMVRVACEELRPGYLLQVNEGDKVPADGLIRSGSGLVDESLLTGESEPVSKSAGDRMVGGSLLLQGNARLEVTAIGKDAVLGQMIELVKTAQQDKPPIQRLADRISAVFVPVVLGIALLTLLVGHFAFGVVFQQALMNAIAVLVISCPCAMGLATPTAVMVGVGRLARNGVLVKGGQTLEQFAGIRRMVFDKTGTLTTGAFQLVDLDYHSPDKARVHALIYELERHSSHPIARSLIKAMEGRLNGVDLGELQVEEVKGEGLRATDAEGNRYRIGRSAENRAGQVAEVTLWQNDRPLATLSLADSVKPEARPLIQYLDGQKIETYILSGDRQAKTEAVARELGIAKVYAEQKPDDKLRVIETLSAGQPTAMVGDGINDAASLARASVGVSLSDASEVAIQSAQIVLLNGRLDHLQTAHALSKETVLIIRQNLFWAFAYNIVAIPIAAAGLLNPMWGALFMAFSDVVVIGNSIRLKFKPISGVNARRLS